MLSKLRFLAMLLALGLSWAGSQPASAVTTRFQAFDLWPQVGERHYFTLQSSQGLYKYQYEFKVSNMFGWHPLDLLDPTGTRIRSVVDYYLGHFVSAGVGITDFWQVGLTLPVFSVVRFEDPLVVVAPGFSNSFKLGDLRFGSKVRLIDANKHRFGLALEPFVTIPLGADDVFMGESSVTGGLMVIGDVILHKRLRLALNLGVQFVGERVMINNIDFQHRYLSSLGLAVDAGKGVTASAEIHGNTTFSDFYSNTDTIPVEFLAGAKWDIGSSGVTLGVGAGSCAICGARGAKARGFINVGYRRLNEEYLLKEKHDEEMMYVTLGLAAAKEEALAYAIYDLIEKCPIERSRYVENRDDPKCMEIYELQDLSCPPEAEYKKGRDNPKCQTVYELRGHDSDKDGLADYLDWCPTEHGPKSAHGCPDNSYLIINPETGEILTKSIQFEFGKSTLMPASEVILNKLAGAIHAQPAIKKLSIEGHTDDVGSEGANMALSHARAQTVHRYLLEQGINPARLVYQGYGERHPVADNATEEGRARNRRVEFIIEKVQKIGN